MPFFDEVTDASPPADRRLLVLAAASGTTARSLVKAGTTVLRVPSGVVRELNAKVALAAKAAEESFLPTSPCVLALVADRKSGAVFRVAVKSKATKSSSSAGAAAAATWSVRVFLDGPRGVAGSVDMLEGALGVPVDRTAWYAIAPDDDGAPPPPPEADAAAPFSRGSNSGGLRRLMPFPIGAAHAPLSSSMIDGKWWATDASCGGVSVYRAVRDCWGAFAFFAAVAAVLLAAQAWLVAAAPTALPLPLPWWRRLAAAPPLPHFLDENATAVIVAGAEIW